MTRFETTDTVGSVVARDPDLSRVFESFGIDYCCGGKKSLAEACSEKGLDPSEVLQQLSDTQATRKGNGNGVSPATMSLTELADHIEQTHHAYLRTELPRLDFMTKKVSAVHGDKEPRLRELRDTFVSLAEELSSHMFKEEQILFPMIRQLEASETAPAFHCGSLANPVTQMEAEHDIAGSALERQRELTDDYQPPDWACNTFRAMVDALARLEDDLHQHIHKENNVLFPRALKLEAKKQGR
jgi:regulator of cell morphogenesis and NO signaling